MTWRRRVLRVLGPLALWTSAWQVSPACAQSDERAQSADDAAGWATPPTAAGAPPAAVSNETLAGTQRASPLHVVAKLGERAGVWLERSQPSRLAQLRSSLELAASYALDFKLGDIPANLRSALGVRAEYDAVYRSERRAYDPKTIEAYEMRLIGQESYIGLRLGSAFELRTGRLLNPLGQGEVQSVVDVLNPRDLRQPGLTEPENLRLPVWTTRISLASDTQRLEGIIVHEASFGIQPPLLGRFSPFRKLLAEDRLAGEQLADRIWTLHQIPAALDPRATQFVARYSYAGHGFDVELYAGTVLDQMGVAALPAPAKLERREVRLDIFHPRYTLLAAAGANSLGAWLVRWELSAQLDRAQSVRDTRYAAPVIESLRRSQVNALVGATFFGLNDVNLGAELAQSIVLRNPNYEFDEPYRLLWPVEAPTLALRYQHQLFDQTVQLSVVALSIGLKPWNGALVSAGLSYVPRDGLRLRLDYAHYQPGSHFGYFYGFERNDRLDLSLSWSLAIL